MKLLAIETATEACSAALSVEGEIISRYRVEPRNHSKLILPMMQSLLAEAELTLGQLDALAFGRGPGGFTGVRIATGVVQGSAFAADLPVVPVSTLAALAQRAYRESHQERLLCAFDARMDEVYWGIYQIEKGIASLQGEESVSSPDQVTLPADKGWVGVGTGWGSYQQRLLARLGERVTGPALDLYCSAVDIAVLGVDGFVNGRSVSPEQACPIYLRDNVAAKPKNPTVLF